MPIFAIMQIEKPVSFREFARMTGTSDGAVRKAIKGGRIKDGFVEVDGEKGIIPSIASEEWGKPLLKNEPEPTPEVVAGDLVDGIEGGELVAGDLPGVADESDEAEIAAVKAFMKTIPQGTTKIEAERLISVFKAQKAKRELEILEDSYVPKDLVFKNLYNFSNILKDNLMNIPDRVIDNLLAAENRNEALIILKMEIVAVLAMLAGLDDIKLSKNE